MSIKLSASEMRKMSQIIDGILNGPADPKEIGYVLLTFDLNTHPNMMNYISNSDRKDMIKALEELLMKFKTEMN